jgi:cytochrome c-type biogenesis protein
MSDLLTAFSLGNQAILLNTCMLPLYPGLIAFLAGSVQSERSRRAMVLVGLMFYLLRQALETYLPGVLPVLYGLIIVFGVLMIAERNPFARLPVWQAPLRQNPYVTAYLYGLLLGPMTLPCIGPFVVSGVFAVGASSIGALLDGLVFFLAFGLGFGWPLVVLPLLAMSLQRRLVGWLAQHHRALARASGALLVAVGIFGIVTELLPYWKPGLDIGDGFKVVYWALAVALTLGIALYTYRVECDTGTARQTITN